MSNFTFNNDSRIFRYIRSLSGQVKLPDVMHQDSTSASTAAGKANLFSKFFHSVFSTNTDPMTLDNSFPDSSLCSINISLDDTYTALTSLDSSKAMGGDGIPPTILKRTAVALLGPIHHLLFLVCRSHTYLKSGVPIALLLFLNQETGLWFLTTVLSPSCVVSLRFWRE